jgi:hypothetical protein
MTTATEIQLKYSEEWTIIRDIEFFCIHSDGEKSIRHELMLHWLPLIDEAVQGKI